MKLQQVVIKTVNGDIEITSPTPPGGLTLWAFLLNISGGGNPEFLFNGGRHGYEIEKKEPSPDEPFVPESVKGKAHYRIYKKGIGYIIHKYDKKEDAQKDLDFFLENIKLKLDGMEVDDPISFSVNHDNIVHTLFRLIN